MHAANTFGLDSLKPYVLRHAHGATWALFPYDTDSNVASKCRYLALIDDPLVAIQQIICNGITVVWSLLGTQDLLWSRQGQHSWVPVTNSNRKPFQTTPHLTGYSAGWLLAQYLQASQSNTVCMHTLMAPVWFRNSHGFPFRQSWVALIDGTFMCLKPSLQDFGCHTWWNFSSGVRQVWNWSFLAKFVAQHAEGNTQS